MNPGPGGVEGVAMLLAPDPRSPWRLPPPFAIEAPHVLSAVAATSPDDVWAVGQARGRPLALHWNGSSWSVPPGPPSPAALVGPGLEGVTARRHSAATEVIAVGGAYDRLLGAEVPLLRHWDGAFWTDLAAPVLPGGTGVARDYVLTDVTLVAPGRAWAVGHAFGRAARLVALFWNGESWHVAEGLPDVPQGKLLAVTGTSPHDVWATGAAGRSGLIVHFDGRTWRRSPSPTTRSPLTDVSAAAPDDVWCAGGGTVLRWNGRKWTRIKVPIGSVNTVTAVSPTNVWLGGARGDLAHYDGHRWTWVPGPDELRDTAVWQASTATHPTGPTWMVGSRRTSDPVTASPHHTTTAHET
ncbi:MAG TPA: hypothetical protein VHJ17_15380 [Thermomonospora sp.]|nr:hypothetical protein [Thermomonospora sp.]